MTDAGISERFREKWQRSALADAIMHVGARAGTAVVNLIGIPILTAVMSTSDYGLAASFRSATSILLVLMTLNLHVAVGRYFHESSTDFSEFFRVVLRVVLALFLTTSLLLVLASGPLCELLDLPQWAIYAAIPAVGGGILLSFFEQIAVAENRSKLLMNALLLQAISRLALSVGLVLLLGGALGRVLGEAITAVAAGAILFLFIRPSRYEGPSSTPLRSWKQHLTYSSKFGLPLVPHSLSGIILASVDQLMITGQRSASEGGRYAIAYALGSVVYTLSQSLQGAWNREFYQLMNEGKVAAVASRMSLIFRLTSAGATLFIVLAPPLVAQVIPGSFHDGLPLIPIIGIGYLLFFFYQNYAAVFFYEKRTALVAGVTVSSGLLNLVTNAIFIPRYGMIAAAYTTLGSFAMMVLAAGMMSYRLLRVRVVPTRNLLFWTTATAILSLAPDLLRDKFHLSPAGEWILRIAIAAGAVSITSRSLAVLLRTRSVRAD